MSQASRPFAAIIEDVLGLYVHLPFCSTHCTYCPFAISTDMALQDEYTNALVREIASHPNPLPAAGSSRRGEGQGEGLVQSIYLGGGTPSRTSLDNLRTIFDAIRARFVLADDAEISMESNPEDYEPGALDAWRALGVNRISIGVQSFVDAELSAISRIHDRARAIDAVRTAVASGARVSLDLMLGLPHQTAASFRETLETAIGLGVGHLSLYMLDLEERTPLEVQVTRGRVVLPDEGLVADLYVEAIERLHAAGLEQYEISNFAKPGEQCIHNLRYWTRGEYLGLGLAAHSFVDGERFANTRDIRKYIQTSPDARDFSEELGPGEVRRETIFLQLRQTSGMCYEDLVALCGQEGIAWTERGLEGGWLRRVGERVAFTPQGFLHSNDYISQLF
jgi:oxygen-independent coproporphyrinogen III oxidase